MIYFDNAATSLIKPECVKEALLLSLNTLGNSARGSHGPALETARMILQTRSKMAKFIDAEDLSTIVFTQNATYALNIAINGIISKGDHVITTKSEHNSVLRPLYKLQPDISISFIEVDELGKLKILELEKMIRSNTKAIVIQMASNVTGNIHDIKYICEIAHRFGVIVICDGAQSIGCMDISVQKLGIDILCFSGHKALMTLQGIGGLYVKSTCKLKPLIVGGSGFASLDKYNPINMPEALEAGTLSGHCIASLNASLDYFSHIGLYKIIKKEQELTQYFIKNISNFKEIKLYGDYDTVERMPIVSLNINNLDSTFVSDWLYENYSICVRSGLHCAPLIHESFKTLDQGMVRFSFSHNNSFEEIDIAIRAMKRLINENA